MDGERSHGLDHRTLVAVAPRTWRSLEGGPQAGAVDLVVDDPVGDSVEVAGRRLPLVDARSDLPDGDPNRVADLVVAVLQLPPSAEVVLLVDDPTGAREAIAVVAALRAEATETPSPGTLSPGTPSPGTPSPGTPSPGTPSPDDPS